MNSQLWRAPENRWATESSCLNDHGGQSSDKSGHQMRALGNERAHGEHPRPGVDVRVVVVRGNGEGPTEPTRL
jgi:hypothetical protein